jgi:hypothetical protein
LAALGFDLGTTPVLGKYTTLELSPQPTTVSKC